MNQARGKLIMNKKIKQSTSSSSRSKWENTKIHIINNKWLYIMTLPGLLYFLIFKYAPMYGVIIAFKDYVPFLGIHGSKWVGLQNFHDFFINPDFMRIMGNTLILSFLSIVISFPAPIILAILLNELSKAIYDGICATFSIMGNCCEYYCYFVFSKWWNYYRNC